MGRYLIGSAEFDYRYIYGEQPRNLAYLARAAGVGECRLRVLLHPLHDGAEAEGEDLSPAEAGLVPYALLAEHGGARGMRFDGPYLIIPEPGDPIRFLEELEEALADDARLLERVEHARLSGARAYIRAAYRLPRVGWPLLLAWINAHLEEDLALRLEHLIEGVHLPDGRPLEEGPLEHALAALRAQDTGSGSMEAFLPLTALHILRHAIWHGLEEMWVEEADEGWDLLLWRRSPLDDQLAALTARLERSPRSATARLSRAVAWARRDRLRLADDDALQALAIRPIDPVARAAFGLLAAARGRHRDAFDALLAVSRAPARRGDLRDLAPLMEAVDGAVRARYPRVTVRDAQRLPDLPRAATALALALHDAVEDLPPPRRVEILSLHLALYPDDVERRAERCELLLRRLGRPEEALQGASLPGVDTPRLARVRAEAHLASGRPAETLQTLRALAALPDVSLRAAAFEALDRPREALETLAPCLAAADVSLADLARAARLHRILGDEAAAEALLERMLRRSTQHPHSAAAIGQALASLPQTERVRWACARFWSAQGQPARALECLEALSPDTPEVRQATATALLALGQAADACALLEAGASAPTLGLLWLQAATQAAQPHPAALQAALRWADAPERPRPERARIHRWCAQLLASDQDLWAAEHHLEISLGLAYTAETLRLQADLLDRCAPGRAAESRRAAGRLTR